MKPKVSVVITLYNQEEYIGETIESVLNQTLEEFELIIVDDKSTDRSLEIAKSYSDSRIEIIESKKNAGTYAAANLGLSVAKGEYVARLDSDDVCTPERLQTQYEFAVKNREYTAVGSWVSIINKAGDKVENGKSPETHEEILAYSYFYNPVFHSSAFFHKDTIKVLGGYSTIRRSQDFRLWNTILANELKIYNIPQCLVERRVHDENMTANYNEEQEQQAVKILIDYAWETLKLKVFPLQVHLMRKSLKYPSRGKLSLKEKVQLVKFLKEYSRAHQKSYPDQKVRNYFDNYIEGILGKIAAKWWSRLVVDLLFMYF